MVKAMNLHLMNFLNPLFVLSVIMVACLCVVKECAIGHSTQGGWMVEIHIALVRRSFVCPNCELMRHQCFACGALGNSNNAAGNAQVFKCANELCEYFYHPNCVAQLLHPNDQNAALELQQTITAGDGFTCPLHKCSVCDELENPHVPDLNLAVCRRCPTAYHRSCLLGQIVVGGVRASSHQLPFNRILMFCLNHEMVPQLGTPARDHIIFP